MRGERQTTINRPVPGGPHQRAIYELNAEFNPESYRIVASLAGLYEREVEAAIGYYERVLELRPGHQGAQARLEALRSQQ